VEIKEIAVQLYQLGLGFRAIGKFLKVSTISVLNWVKKAGNELPELSLLLSVRVMELDEMWQTNLYLRNRNKRLENRQEVMGKSQKYSLSKVLHLSLGAL